MGFFALVFLALVASSWELAADSRTDSSGLRCGAGARRGSLLSFPLIEGWGEDEVWLTPLVRPHVQRAVHDKKGKKSRTLPGVWLFFLNPSLGSREDVKVLYERREGRPSCFPV